MVNHEEKSSSLSAKDMLNIGKKKKNSAERRETKLSVKIEKESKKLE